MKRKFFNWLQRVFNTAGEEKSTRGHVLNATLSAEPKERNTTRVLESINEPEKPTEKTFDFLKTSSVSELPFNDDLDEFTEKQILGKKEGWMFQYLCKKRDYVSPTELAKEYGMWFRRRPYRRNTSIRVLNILCEKGLVTKNEKGHYKAIKEIIAINSKEDLSEKEDWMLQYLHKKRDYVSPTELAKEYGLFSRGKAYGTSTSHRVLISLWEKGLVTKNEKGHYKAIC